MRLIAKRSLTGAINTYYSPIWQGRGHIVRRCYSDSSKRTYDDAINLLNTLQTPYAELKRQWDAGIKRGPEDFLHTKHCSLRMGYKIDDFAKLNIIHVAGTKGKGTVCAYVDSILNQYRLSESRSDGSLPRPRKVGLYTSPHLISVRERIRINSAPISEKLFAKYFFEVWDKICVTDQWGRTPINPLPVYFRFLTLMSFHVFLSESVEVAIYEVGMGGEYDATNIISRPAVTGITALGIDHTFHLGKTIDQIAWHKAGIFMENVPAYTVPQPREAMAVLEDRALQSKTKELSVIEEDPDLKGIKITPNARFQKQNAALAISLAKEVLKKIDPENHEHIPENRFPEEFVRGIEGAVSRGRCEVKIDSNVAWYLDGAHTAESMAIASKWFCDEVQNKTEPKILIFNQQGHRESMELMEGLFAATQRKVTFDHVIFCPSIPSASSTRKDHVNLQADQGAITSLKDQKSFATRWEELVAAKPSKSLPKIKVLPSLEEAFEYVKNVGGRGEEEEGEVKARVFVTGSIHLVGRALSLLEGVDAL